MKGGEIVSKKSFCKNLHIRISDEQMNVFNAACKKHGRTKSEAIRLFIKYLESECLADNLLKRPTK